MTGLDCLREEEEAQEMKKAEIIVRETTDYGMFKKIMGNRDVLPERVAKIEKSMREHGVKYVPILVNEKYEVIDGQGRLEALERLGLPVLYIVQDGLTIDDCIALNISSTGWKVVDFIDCYASMGREDYMLLRHLINQFPEFTVSIVVDIAGGRIGGTHKRVKAGTFVMPETSYKKSVSDLMWLKGLNVVKYKKNFVLAALFCKDINGCNQARLTSVVTDYFKEVNAGAKVEDICANIMDRYNWHLGDDKRIDFKEEYRKYCKMSNTSWNTRFNEEEDEV